MNKVLPGLFVGNYRDSKDTVQLERHKISHIVAIHDAARRLHPDKEYLCIMASDTPYQNLSQYFPTCNDFIHQARTQGGHVLIHCLAGMSRSVTIAVAYIMSITTLQLTDSQKVLRGARPVSCPNSGFQKQLQEFEASKLFEERRRLLEKFPGTTFLECDEDYCKRLLVSYNNLIISRRICDGRCASARSCPTGLCRARLARLQSTESVTARIMHTSPNSSPAKHKVPNASSRTVSCPNTPFKNLRDKEATSNNNYNSPNHSIGTPSPRRRRLPSIGSVQRQSSNASNSPSPKSAWERHYGCLNSTLLRNRANNLISQEISSRPGSPMVSISASSSSPMQYPRNTQGGTTRRADSVTSINSVTSVMSLPAQCMTTATTTISSVQESSSPNRRSNSPMPFSPNASLIPTSRHYNISSASPLSCPPTPRRSVTRRTLPSSPIILASERRTPLAVMDDFDETLTVVIEPTTSNKSPSSPGDHNNKLGVISNSASRSTSSSNSSWAVSPASYCITSNNKKSSSAPEIVAHEQPVSSRVVRLPQRGITRWVMKRSAYKYTMENNYN